jgi:hypothetical protein
MYITVPNEAISTRHALVSKLSEIATNSGLVRDKKSNKI